MFPNALWLYCYKVVVVLVRTGGGVVWCMILAVNTLLSYLWVVNSRLAEAPLQSNLFPLLSRCRVIPSSVHTGVRPLEWNWKKESELNQPLFLWSLCSALSLPSFLYSYYFIPFLTSPPQNSLDGSWLNSKQPFKNLHSAENIKHSTR